MTRTPSYLLSLAGEYRVCSELNRRGVFATVTYGNRKNVDVYAIGDRRKRAVKIEVKTAQQKRFITNISRKGLCKEGAEAPDFWVLFQTKVCGDSTFKERFFILTHREICQAQHARNLAATGRRKSDPSTGVDNVTVGYVEKYEDQWPKILRRVGRAAD